MAPLQLSYNFNSKDARHEFTLTDGSSYSATAIPADLFSIPRLINMLNSQFEAYDRHRRDKTKN